MVASKGGISYETAATMPPSQRRLVMYALAQTHGADIDWDSGEIRPPKHVQEQMQKKQGLQFSRRD